jgi:hypothetical protein
MNQYWVLPFFLSLQLLFSIKEFSEDSSDEEDELSPTYCAHTVYHKVVQKP